MKNLLRQFLIPNSQFLILLSVLCVSSVSRSQSRFEIDVAIGYSHPLLEAYGKDNVLLDSSEKFVLIDGERLIVSDNLGTDVGYTVQVYGKYSILRQGYLKGLFNVGYNRLYSIYSGPSDDFGVRVQSFSVGAGLEANPLAKFKFNASIFGLLRYNLVGGESYYHAGLDFFKVTSRFGYSAGIRTGYRYNNNIGFFLSWTYSYDNAWNKQTGSEQIDPRVDAHTIPFRDKAGDNNGLTHDRRIAYASYSLGMTFYFK